VSDPNGIRDTVLQGGATAYVATCAEEYSSQGRTQESEWRWSQHAPDKQTSISIAMQATVGALRSLLWLHWSN